MMILVFPAVSFSRLESRKILRQAQLLGVPTVDLFGLHSGYGIPRFSDDHKAISTMAADYFLELGYPECMMKLFKRKTGITPSEFHNVGKTPRCA